MPLITRRSLITGLVSLVAAPAIVRASSLMPVKAYRVDLTGFGLAPLKAEGEWLAFDPMFPAFKMYLDGDQLKREPIHWTKLYRAP